MGTTIDVRALAEELLKALDTSHEERKQGVILLHNAIMEAVKALAPAEPAVVEVASEPVTAG